MFNDKNHININDTNIVSFMCDIDVVSDATKYTKELDECNKLVTAHIRDVYLSKVSVDKGILYVVHVKSDEYIVSSFIYSQLLKLMIKQQHT